MKNDYKLVTSEDLQVEMKYQSEIYDIVRLVDPISNTVMKYENGKLVASQKEPCFSVWEKGEKCQNCISNQACSYGKRVTKFEFRRDEAYYVLAVPYKIVDDFGEHIVSMELVNRVSNDFQVHSYGVDQTSELIRALNLKSYEDTLTGTFNRRYYDDRRFLYDDIKNFPKKVAFLMVDVNHFKKINNMYGHVHADDLLAKIGEILRRSFRNSDRIIRMGGDEFLVIVRDCSQIFLEKKIVRVKNEIAGIRFNWMGDNRPSVAIGMTYTDSFTGRKEQIDEMFGNADENMYKDKEAPIPITTSKTILIVDDVEMNREFIKVQLFNKFHVMEAGNGEDALIILKTNHVDLIITDIFMNPMNGYDFMKSVRNNPNMKNIPIIAVTENFESSQSKAIAAGADIYIDRPAREDMLVKSIMQLTEQDHGRRDLFDMDFVLDSIPGAVLVGKFSTSTHEILYCSRGIYNITGVESDKFPDVIHESGPNIIYDEDIVKVTKCVERIINTRSRGEIIFRSYKNDGSLTWLWMQGRYIGEEEGLPIIEEIVLDVSNTTNMYETILDEASSLINVIDVRSCEILYSNNKSIELSGGQIGKACYERFFGRNEKCKNCVINRHFDDTYSKEVEIHGKYYRQTFKKIVWNGRIALLQCMDDITEQKILQEYTEKEKDTLNQIIQNVPSGVFVFNLDKSQNLKLIEANPTACALMGIDFNKTIGSGADDVYKLTHPEDRKIIENLISKVSVPDVTVHYEYRQYNKVKKDYLWLSASAHSVLAPDNTINVYVSYFDITEQKRAQKLQEDLKIAQMENQAKTDFMSNMSHDMRTPLNGILGLAHLMTEKTDVDELQNHAKQLVSSGKLLLNLVNDTLDMNKIESGKFTLNMEPMDSASVFRDILATAEMYADQSGIKMEFDLPEIPMDKWIPVICDTSRLEQILINVISNAIKYSGKGKIVELHMRTIEVTEDTVVDEYRIVDHGIGMSEEFLPHMFEPFVQEGRKQTQGTGLGMSIVKQLVELMGGTITVDSKLDEGTTVTIVMKYEVYKGDLFKQKAEKEIRVEINGMRVLLCEDHPLNSQIVVQLLNSKGVIVDSAENGKIGLEKFEQSEQGFYDAILMDVRMPVMDGIEATKAIRELNRNDAKSIPILAMTANAFAEDKQETKAAGMNEHLAKPVDPGCLYKTLAKYYNEN